MTRIIKSINPATLETLFEIPETSPGIMDELLQRSRNAFAIWRETSLKDRMRILSELQQILFDRADEIAQTITLETGRPLVESLAIELEATIDLTGYYARYAAKFISDRTLRLHNIFFLRRTSLLHFEPLGPLGIISPWNWPLLIPAGCIIPALLPGNTVIFKPSEYAPKTGQLLHRAVIDSGVPPDVFQIVQGGAAVGKALVQAEVEKIFFTGSTETGRVIMAEGATTLTKSVLELGGHDPAIVCDDADLETASSGIVWGGFSNCGQNCNAIERVYVHHTVAEDFIDLVVSKVKALRVGDGMDESSDMGPLANETQLKKIESIVKDTVKRGGRVLTGGSRIGKAGYFFEPTVIRMEKPQHRPDHEEIFGPVIFITSVKDDEEAICLANSTKYGLASSVWTKNKKHGLKIARRIEAGTVMINDVIVSFGIPEAGWTGIKKSGVGWVHGEKGLDEMVNIQYINYDPQYRVQKFWWFPYSQNLIDGMRSGMRFLFSKSIVQKAAAIPGTLLTFSGYLVGNRRRSDKI